MLEKKLCAIHVQDPNDSSHTIDSIDAEENNHGKIHAEKNDITKDVIELNDLLEEEKYSRLLSCAYMLMAIISESPFYIIITLGDYFKSVFHVEDTMINEFTIIESVTLIVICLMLHLIGSYRLKWNLYCPLMNVVILVTLYMFVFYMDNPWGHKIMIYSALPLGVMLCVAKMTTIKICSLFRKSYSCAYICGLSLSGFLVFLLYILGTYALFNNHDNKFYKIFSLFCGTIVVLSLICFLLLYKMYRMPFVKRLEEKYGDSGFLIKKNIIENTWKTIPIIGLSIAIAFLNNCLTFQIYPAIFPASVQIKKELKGFLSGILLFGDSLARILVYNAKSGFIKIHHITYVFLLFGRYALVPFFFLTISTRSNAIYKTPVVLILLAIVFGFFNGILNNVIFLKSAETCKKKNKQVSFQLCPNIIYLSHIFGACAGNVFSKLYLHFLPSIQNIFP